MRDRVKRLRFFGSMVVLLGVCVLLLCGCQKAEEAQAESEADLPVITVGSDNYPPFNYVGSDGAPIGIDVELATEAFRRMGYRANFVTINWEDKQKLVESGAVDCIWGSFSMDGREDSYTWAGPYMLSRQVVAVRMDSPIYSLKDLEDKTLVVQSTTKPEELFQDSEEHGLPHLRALYSLQDRDLIYTTLIKGYADALAAHETAIRQFMSDYSVEYRILDEPLMISQLGVAFAKDRDDDLPQQLTDTFAQMLADGTTRRIISGYLDEPDHYLNGLEVSRDD